MTVLKIDCNSSAMKTLLRCKITIDEDGIDMLWGILALHISFGWEEESLPTGETVFIIHAESQDFFDNLVADVKQSLPQAVIVVDEIAKEDWSLAWREYFTPIACGKRFMVLPPWLKDDTELEQRIPIIIEPKSAFGTGHHNTTALCLGVISELLEQGRLSEGMQFLDIGTGSGILGLGCCLSGLYGIGVDIEIPSIENAKENILLNNIASYDTVKKEGFDVRLGSVELVQGQDFELVVANILARPLIELAGQILPLVRTGGCLVLSGILNVQAKDVEEAYQALGLGAACVVVDADWVALVWDNVGI